MVRNQMTVHRVKRQWALKVLRHWALFKYLGQFLPLSPSVYPPRPERTLDLLSARLALFVYNIEKGEKEWFRSCTGFTWK